MKTIRLYGEMAEKFGDTWHFDVRTPGEVFRALSANRPDFMRYLHECAHKKIGYEIVAGDFAIDADGLLGPFSDKEVLHITPVFEGSKSGGLIIGALLVIASFIPGLNVAVWASLPGTLGTMTYASIAFSIGASMVLGGMSKVLAGTPDTPTGGTYNAGDSKPGYYFSGPAENVAVGSAIPVGYGRLLIGAQSISSGLEAEDMI